MVTASTCLRATKNVLCGQVVSLFSLLALVMAKRLVYRTINTPVLLNACFYVVLAAVYLLCNSITPPRSAPPPPETKRVTIKWWVYPVLAIIDLQANICAATALQYTTFATTGLALNLAVPFVFTLSVCAFRASYKWSHCLGCLVTLAGGGVLLFACYDRQSGLALGSQNEVYGWALAVLASMLYAGSTVINQWCMQQRGLDAVLDFFGRVAAWSALTCTVAAALVERDEILAINWDTQIVLLFVGYVLCMFAFYTAVFVLVEATESPLYNLSLLCSGLYLMLLARHSLDETIETSTCVASLIMLVGLAMYTLTREPEGSRGSRDALPQIAFKSMHSPRELVPNKLQIAEV